MFGILMESTHAKDSPISQNWSIKALQRIKAVATVVGLPPYSFETWRYLNLSIVIYSNRLSQRELEIRRMNFRFGLYSIYCVIIMIFLLLMIFAKAAELPLDW